jgi:UDP-N-acetyl-D-glucosamine dehydrogenase
VTERNETKNETIAVVGMGYVGLPLAMALVRAGNRVYGLDNDAHKVAAIASGESYIKHIPSEPLRKAVATGQLIPSSDFACVRLTHAVLICVPTPLTAYRTPDLSYVESTARSIAPHLRRGHLVVLESTTYPGTTDEVMVPILEKGSGLRAGADFLVAYSPEREDPGNLASGLSEIPKLVGGIDSESCTRACEIYRGIVRQVVPVSSCRVAEAAKLLENIFRSVNIALVNELKVIYAAMGIDIWEVIAAASTKPFGFMPFYPGPGLGGHCIPIDPFYLTYKALEYGQRTRLIELSGEINTAMPEYVVAQVTRALNDDGKSVRGARILLLGLAYKPDVDDDRESPTYEIISLLEERGGTVAYNDPHIAEIRPGRSHHWVAGRKSQPIEPSYDLIVVCTHHKEYAAVDFAALGVPVVDCRNAVRKRPSRYYQA